ncbi:Elongation factor 1-delta [Apostasia shenzhenica]|uniref:Elongation factor 1-delta n=1 Tax=Apostasia shenzhenica TaxID=1088818 RepID=A0A2I0ADL0_9ASPA|nr:Elongation factor 1-delta [Apostasia shenzhenica]
MAVSFLYLDSESGLKKLVDYRLTRSYITGYHASRDDITVHATLATAPASHYVNASRWYNHIEALLRMWYLFISIAFLSWEGKGVKIEGSSSVYGEAPASPPVADSNTAVADEKDDDDVDLFGEETEEEKKAAEERAAAGEDSGKKERVTIDPGQTSGMRIHPTVDRDVPGSSLVTSDLRVRAGKSSVLLDVKPWDDETDMKKLEDAILLTIIDDHLTAEPANECIQSCDIVAFNKICKSLLL